MLVLLLHQLVVALHPRLCGRLVSTYNNVRQIYNQNEVRQVRFYSLKIAIVQIEFCDSGFNRGLFLVLKLKGTCFSKFDSNHGPAHFTPIDLLVVCSWRPSFLYSQVFSEIASARIEVMLASKQPSVILQKSGPAVNHLKRFPAKSTDPQNGIEVADYSPITHPYPQSSETKLSAESLLEGESKPAMMLSAQNILLPAEVVDPGLFPKTNPIISKTCGIRSISLENC